MKMFFMYAFAKYQRIISEILFILLIEAYKLNLLILT